MSMDTNERMAVNLKTARNNATGAITVTAPTFTVTVSENGVQIQFEDNQKPRSNDADAVSPRSMRSVRRRGAQ
jgi:c-di-GMP-binding flagellar brake protein YcgR